MNDRPQTLDSHGDYSAKSFAGALELFVIQPTSFCNINCDYCYLPDRAIRRLMSQTTLLRAFQRLFESSFVSRQFSVVWHAGEPLSVPLSFYEEALENITALNTLRCEVQHNIQTNATLLNDKWCRFLAEKEFQVGISLDGPKFLHDLHRKRRSGKGTFEDAMRGMSLLQDHEIKFRVICVVTQDSLDHADEIFAFFENLGVTSLAFNIEEAEGANRFSSLSAASDGALRLFVNKLFTLWLRSRRRYPIREFDGLLGAVGQCSESSRLVSQQADPFRIISVDVDGNFSTFSPELLAYKDFWFGNVITDVLDNCVGTERFRRVYDAILDGIEQCKATCDYFCLCGGGAPSNKFFERGTFACSETRHCINTKKVFVDEIFDVLEVQFGLRSARRANGAPADQRCHGGAGLRV